MKNDLSPQKEKILFGDDSIIIRKFNGGIPGGRTLDVTDFVGDVIYAGHVIIKVTDTTKNTVTYKPMPVTPAVAADPNATPAVEAQEAKYGSLPSNGEYVGILYRSISKEQPTAAIMYDGVVNTKLLPYKMTDILTAFKTAVPHIIFEQDEEA